MYKELKSLSFIQLDFYSAFLDTHLKYIQHERIIILD